MGASNPSVNTFTFTIYCNAPERNLLNIFTRSDCLVSQSTYSQQSFEMAFIYIHTSRACFLVEQYIIM